MKTFLLLIFSCFFFEVYCQEYLFSQMGNGDTVTINYSIASGELGSIHKGIILAKENGQIKATHVVYNYGISFLPNGMIEVANTSFIPMNEDSIKTFYKSFQNDFTILKKQWIVDDKQINCLEKFFKEAQSFKSHGFSNAPEYYLITRKDKELIVIDRSGKWDKYSYLKKALDL